MTESNEVHDSDADRKARIAAVRERARLDEARRRRQGRVLRIGGVGVAVFVLGALAVVFTREAPEKPEPGTEPTRFDAQTSITTVTGPGRPRHEVVILEDFGCQGCAEFASTTDADLREQVDSGQASVTYRPLVFLDELSGTRWSARAANAALCAAREGSRHSYTRARSRLFEMTPAQGASAPSDDHIVRALSEGWPTRATEDLRECVETQPWQSKLAADTAAWKSEDRIHTVPAVTVDGKEVAGPLVPGTGERDVPGRKDLLRALAD